MSAGAVEEAPQLRAAQPVVLTTILTAALDAFNEHGYHGATVRDIAGRVGVTVPALYYHHENKEALLYALLDASITRIGDLTKEVEKSTADPVERFDALVECIVRYTAVSGKLSHLDAEIRSLGSTRRRSYSAKRSAIEKRVLTAVEEGADQGRFDVVFPRDTVRALLGMIQAITTWYHPEGELSLDDLVERYVAIAGRMAGRR